MRILTTVFLHLFLVTFLSAQDAFFFESNQIRGFLNPALTGINGSFSVTALSKEQYTNTFGDFLSAGVSVEESFPCVKVDAGLFYIFDREGDGLFTTHHAGFNFVYTIPFDVGRFANNIRVGTKFQYTLKSIDWDRLTFSDQVDPKYNLTDAFGIPNITDFVPPDWRTSSRMTMGLGIIHRVKLGKEDRRNVKWSLTWGGAVENYTNVFESQGYDSILRLQQDKNRLIDKWSIYVAPEFPLTKSYTDYFGFRPSLVVLQESSLTNIQLGFDINYRRAYGLGMYLGTGQLEDFRSDTKSYILNAYLRVLTTKLSQLNVGFQYVHNIGGLSEVFGQTMQLTVSYAFKKDGCASTPNVSTDCPSISARNEVLYENIWFSPVEGINK
ncbi:MAG: type IX secretion system membrane protein PorP/SprF [Bacteroidota bacterium]